MPDHLGSDQRKVKPDDGEEKEIQGKFLVLVELMCLQCHLYSAGRRRYCIIKNICELYAINNIRIVLLVAFNSIVGLNAICCCHKRDVTIIVAEL